MSDERARKRIRESLDESLLVEAAAGTGKTTELVARMVAVLASGRGSVDRVAAVTFTRKAAGELKLRLRQELDAARRAADGAERDRLAAALGRLEEARIGTIHSFCADLLRERPVEAGIDPDFVELDEDDAQSLFGQAFDGWLQERLGAGSPVLRRALARGGSRGGGPIDGLRAAGWDLCDHRDHPRPWRREPFDRAAALDELLAGLADLVALAAQGPKSDPLRVTLAPAEEVALALDRAARAAGRRDDDAVEGEMLRLRDDLRRLSWRSRARKGRFGPIDRAAVVEARDRFLAALESFRRTADADLAAVLRLELAGALERYAALKARDGKLDFLDLLLDTRNLLRDRPDARQWFQQRFSHLFVDELQDTDPLQLEILLLLAADDPGEGDWRRTRPAAGKLFLVGDPKQSIYRFRRADVALYEEVRDLLAQRGVGIVHLSRSFRSLRPLQQLVNAAFAPVMTGDAETGQPHYIALDEARPARPEVPAVVALPAPHPYGWSNATAKAVSECLPQTIAAFVDWLVHDSGWTVEDPDRRGAQTPIRTGHVALLFRKFASWGGDAARPFIRELEARNLPHVLLGSRSYHQREEVQSLRAALRAIEWPDDELAVFATLKGPLLAVPDELLLRFRLEHGPLHPFRPRRDLAPELAPIDTGLTLLADLHRQRNRVPLPATLHRLLEATRAHAGLALRPAGEQVLANVRHLVELARRHELKGGISFRGFVERLEEDAETTGARQAAAVEEGAEGVRLMTVHSAKGLEFPVVVLADPMTPLAAQEPREHADSRSGLWAGRLFGCAPWELLDNLDRESRLEAAEGVRLAYVAATRARDLLVVPAAGSGPVPTREPRWLAALDPALYPPEDRWGFAQVPAGCPPFGPLSVLSLPESFRGEPPPQVRPGLHHAQAGAQAVVWWDPALLRLEVDANFGLRQEEILKEDAGGTALGEALAAHAAWRERVADAVVAGGRPSLAVATVTEITAPAAAVSGAWPPAPAAAPASAASPARDTTATAAQRWGAAAGGVELAVVPRDLQRPAGPRFGSLVHNVLRDVPLTAGEDAVRAMAVTHARLLQASDEEREAAAAAVVAALAHPLLRRAAAADEVLREVPFVLRLSAGGRGVAAATGAGSGPGSEAPVLGEAGDGAESVAGEASPEGPPALLEGTLDLAFREGDTWTLVDFKTDADAAGREAYRRQVAWYAEALRAQGAGDVRGTLLAL